jgi:predicted nucleic acid-binding protein
MTISVFGGALDIKSDFGFSYWESAIIAAARELGWETLFSADMSHDRRVSGVRIVNPLI